MLSVSLQVGAHFIGWLEEQCGTRLRLGPVLSTHCNPQVSYEEFLRLAPLRPRPSASVRENENRGFSLELAVRTMESIGFT